MLRASLAMLMCLATAAYLVVGQIVWSRRRLSFARLSPHIRDNWVD